MLEDAIVEEVWFFDGDQGHVLGCVGDDPDSWLIERGVLLKESNEFPDLADLIEGDAVYRIRKDRALKRAPDEREGFFSWTRVVIE